ncbi:MAG: LysR substrate-binding domain-containing protein [Halofilum sp. (in: g-proteobacteria)]|nr:LysR substrate-binding domain-containing protein [Halofilum sp. (in: g-proteobacteria)]
MSPELKSNSLVWVSEKLKVSQITVLRLKPRIRKNCGLSPIVHDFVFYSSNQARSDMEFADGTRIPFSRMRGSITVNSVRAVRDVVMGGAGIHLGPQWAFREALDEGRLVRLLPDRPLRSFPVQAVYPARNYLPRKTRILIRKLSETIGAQGV